MADINLNINVLDGNGCPTLMFIDTTDLSITINGGTPILADNAITEPVPQDTTVTIEITKTGYDGYSNSIDVEAVDVTLNIVLNEAIPVDFINITESCHSYTINNTGTTSDEDVTYSITDLDNVVIGDNLDVVLDHDSSKVFTTTEDGVYLVIVKDSENVIIRQYVILDICDILACVTSRILAILCKDCDCHNDDCIDYCKLNYELQRIHLLGFDLLNRINREYRLNSYYTTIDEAKIYELRTAQDVIDKLNNYCGDCGTSSADTTNFGTVYNTTSSTSNSDCGCS